MFGHSFHGFTKMSRESPIGAGQPVDMPCPGTMRAVRPGGGPAFWASKRGFDLLVVLAAAPAVAAVAGCLAVLNPALNPGPLFYSQHRMGRDGRAFRAVKFRTMRPAPEAARRRGPDDPVEDDRIPPFGRWLRRSRIDELPQFWNVARGEMSLIGPRPDMYDHAVVYARTVPGYAERHAVPPGISGYAQVYLGYAEGTESTYRKALKDRVYIANAGWPLEIRIMLRTLRVVLDGFGAK